MTCDASPVPPPLPPDDQAALDLLIDAHMDLSTAATQRSDLQGRMRRALSLLQWLELPPSSSPSSPLVNLTYLRVLRDRDERLAQGRNSNDRSPVLSTSDALALDVLIESGWAEHQSERATRATHLLALLDHEPIDSADRSSRIDATLDSVLTDAKKRRERLRLHPIRSDTLEYSRRTINWRDLVAVAAMLLIAFGVVLSLVEGARFESQQLTGASGLSRAGIGFGLFANDHDAHLPQAHQSGLDGRWWEIGNSQESHSAHLYLLVTKGYITLGDLASPGNPHARVVVDPDAADWASPEELSYSMQLYGHDAPRLALSSGGRQQLLLADRSPVIERARRGVSFDPMAGSTNFRGLGQNVLAVDGSVAFLRSPILATGDNIWLPRPVEQENRRLTGRETPAPGDAYLGP